jgi:hydrogenase maturation protease
VKVLIAGIGNVFFGDDGFGSVVARALAGASLPEGVVVRDFGIRGLDLAYELTSGYDAAILVDAAGRGGEPGELFVLEPKPSLDSEPPSIDAHALTPEAVLRTCALARRRAAAPAPRRLRARSARQRGRARRRAEPARQRRRPPRAALDRRAHRRAHAHGFWEARGEPCMSWR